MPFTVSGAFKAFQEDKVDLLADVTKNARLSRDYLIDNIKNLAKAQPTFPKITGSFVPFGSFARRSKIRPLDDIDMLVCLDGRSTTCGQYQSVPYSYWLKATDSTSPLAQFNGTYGYVNSTKLLNQIRDSLGKITNYKRADISKNMEAVVLDLLSYDWVFDIVPAVTVYWSNSNTLAYYLIPDGTGDWKRTNPNIDSENFNKTRFSYGPSFYQVIRLLKYWNRRTHKPRLSSYYFETVVLKVFAAISEKASLQEAIQYFFLMGPTYISSRCADPKNLEPNLDHDVDSETKQKVIAAMSTAYSYSSSAIVRESKGDHQEAIRIWQNIFGLEFPSYG